MICSSSPRDYVFKVSNMTRKCENHWTAGYGDLRRRDLRATRPTHALHRQIKTPWYCLLGMHVQFDSNDRCCRHDVYDVTR